jgi:hypothetical protein
VAHVTVEQAVLGGTVRQESPLDQGHIQGPQDECGIEAFGINLYAEKLVGLGQRRLHARHGNDGPLALRSTGTIADAEKSLPGSRRRRLAVAVIVVAFAAALAARRVFIAPPQRLGPESAGTDTGLDESNVGDVMNVFLGGFNPHGSATVHVRAVRLTGVPAGLRVVGLYALEDGPTAGVVRGDLRARKDYGGEKLVYRPVTDMTFHAGTRERWTLLIIVQAERPGRWRTTGIDVDWKSGWYQGTAHYRHTVSMTVQP